METGLYIYNGPNGPPRIVWGDETRGTIADWDPQTATPKGLYFYVDEEYLYRIPGHFASMVLKSLSPLDVDCTLTATFQDWEGNCHEYEIHMKTAGIFTNYGSVVPDSAKSYDVSVDAWDDALASINMD